MVRRKGFLMPVRGLRGDFSRHAVVLNPVRSVAICFHWHLAKPPVHDTVGLGKKSMPTDINSISLKVHGPGNSTHVVGAFQNNGLDICSCQEFVGSGQSCRSCADEYSRFLVVGRGTLVAVDGWLSEAGHFVLVELVFLPASPNIRELLFLD